MTSELLSDNNQLHRDETTHNSIALHLKQYRQLNNEVEGGDVKQQKLGCQNRDGREGREAGGWWRGGVEGGRINEVTT